MSSPSPTPPAVFLSYEREDSEADRRIATALRASGVEVWFDQNEPLGVVRSWRLNRSNDPGFGNLTAKNAKSAEKTQGLFFVISAFFAVNGLD
jgi:hypothetical protein